MLKIFIADDSTVVRERLITMFSELHGVEMVGEAADVPTSISLIRDKRPDVVILDFRMPGGNGIDVLKKIKDDKLNPVVIVLTNYAFPQYRKACFASGADFFFNKSTEFEELLKVLAELSGQTLTFEAYEED